MIAGLEFGSAGALRVRRERVVCGSLGRATVRLLLASDLHLTARRTAPAASLVDVVRRERPDAVLLGGDLVDRATGVRPLADAVAAITRIAPLAAVPGNHDARCGIAAVRDAIVRGDGVWLPERDLLVATAGDSRVVVHGRAVQRAAPGVRVLVGHHPATVAEAAQRCGYDVGFAGHLHGGQFVLWRRGARLYPGALLKRWNGLRFDLARCTLLVGLGAADTLPVRFRCPREVVMCELAGACR